jgi:hypothetical protein
MEYIEKLKRGLTEIHRKRTNKKGTHYRPPLEFQFTGSADHKRKSRKTWI